MTLNSILKYTSLLLLLIPWGMYVVYWSRIPQYGPTKGLTSEGEEVRGLNKWWCIGIQGCITLFVICTAIMNQPFDPLISGYRPEDVLYKWSTLVQVLVFPLVGMACAWNKVVEGLTGRYSRRRELVPFVIMVLVWVSTLVFEILRSCI